MTSTETSATEEAAPSRSAADRLARRVLRIENAAPRALLPMKGSLIISAVRCVITYAIIPALAPLVTGLAGLATPLSLFLSFVAGVMAVVSLRRVWLADWSGRWAYTAFAVLVLASLAVVVVFDIRRLMA